MTNQKPRSINPSYARLCARKAEEQRDVFQTVANGRNVLPQTIEKDFWVCRVIDILFNGFPPMPKLFFKGGTSLSKGYELINRFSEDVDIVLSAPGLGFSGNRDPAGSTISGEMRKKVLSKSKPNGLPAAVRHYVGGPLKTRLEELLPDCDVETLKTDDDYGAALTVKYPTITDKDTSSDSYLTRSVLIECGARSARTPLSSRDIVPYIHDVAAIKKWNLTVPRVCIISPKRTFWDKALILHTVHHRHAADKLKWSDRNRKSRHYYDVAMFLDTDIGNRAIRDMKLLDAVKKTLKATGYKSAELADAKPGTFKLVPPDALLSKLTTDYDAMSAMMFGEPKSFKWVLDQLTELEGRING